MPSSHSPFSERLPSLLTTLLAAEYQLYRAVTALLGQPGALLSSATRGVLKRQLREGDVRLNDLAVQIGLHGGHACLAAGAPSLRPATTGEVRTLQGSLLTRLRAAVRGGLDIFDDNTPNGFLSALHLSHAAGASRLSLSHDEAALSAA